MKMNVTKIDKNRRIVAGVVKDVRQNTTDTGYTVTNVKLEGKVWNREAGEEETNLLDIAFWNNERVALADMVLAAKVAPGAVIAVEVYERDGKLTGNRFMYRGQWTIPETDEHKEKNVFMGVVASVKSRETSSGSTFTSISIPVDQRDGSETKWASITFWNNDISNIADRARKVLSEKNGKKMRAIVVTGEARENGDFTNYNGYDFILLPEQKEEE